MLKKDKNNIFANFTVAAKQMKKGLVVLRRKFHQHPESGFSEFNTSRIITKRLQQLGLKVKTGIAGTGVVGLIKGKGPRCAALRVEMDAVPIQEKRVGRYASSVPGLMHACGHDVHMAVAIGVASVLAKHSHLLKGNVKFIFQPSEEVLPGQKSGAQEMVKAGVLSNPDVDAIFALHCWPEFHVGKVEIGAGPVMASAETFCIRIIGGSAHAGLPHKGKDAILVAAEVISSLNHIVSRKIAPDEPVVLNIGMVRGGKSESIIADSVEMRGTIRAVTKKTHQRVKEFIRRCVLGICAGYDVKYKLEFRDYFPTVINDGHLDRLAEIVSRKLLGPENVTHPRGCSMTGEDFSVYLEDVPGLYLKLGTADEKGRKQFPLHHPMFDIDERVICLGVSLLSSIIYEYLEQ